MAPDKVAKYIWQKLIELDNYDSACNANFRGFVSIINTGSYEYIESFVASNQVNMVNNPKACRGQLTNYVL